MTHPKEKPRDSHLTRERILFAAKSEFAANGFSGARMGSIAARAGSNQALIHYYFDTKERLYMEVLHRLFSMGPDDSVIEKLRSWNLTPPESLYVTIYLFMRITRDASDPDFHRIIAREIAEGRTHLKSILREYLVPRLALLENVVKDGVESGDFRAGNTIFVVFSMMSLVLSYESNRDNYDDTPMFERLYGGDAPDEYFQFVMEMVFKSLTPAGMTPVIPEIPPERLLALDMIVDEIKRRQNWPTPA